MKRLFLFALSVQALSGLAWAAPTSSSAEMRAVIAGFARCVVKRDYDRAKALVLANDDNETLVRKHGQLIDGSCLPPGASSSPGGLQVRFSGDLVYYALADTLVSTDFRDAPARDVKTAKALQHRLFEGSMYKPKSGKKLRARKAEELETKRGVALASYHLSRFGECVVRADPVKSRALLLTTPSAEAEASLLTALTPTFGVCHEAGRPVESDPMMLRGAVAVNYYRLAYAPRVAEGATR